MYIPDTNDNIYRLVSVDPGTDTLGIALNSFDLNNMSHMVDDVFTWTSSKYIKRNDTYGQFAVWQGDRYARLLAHKTRLVSYLHEVRPNGIVFESPFYNRLRPGSYGPLMECLTILQEGAREYDMSLPIYLIAPQKAKTAFSIVDKHNVAGGIEHALTDRIGHSLYLNPNIDMYSLDEHSLDALMIGHHCFLDWIYRNQLINAV